MTSHHNLSGSVTDGARQITGDDGLTFGAPGFSLKSIERQAPHIEPSWLEKFAVTLAVRDVAGASIGDAIAEVDSYVLESGESAEAAFGEPVAYARSLGLARTGRQHETRFLHGAMIAVALLGICLAAAIALATRDTTRYGIAVGDVVSVVLIAIFFVATLRAYRFLARQALWVEILSSILMICCLLPIWLFRQAVATVPGYCALGVAAAIAIAGCVGQYVVMSRSTTPIVFPVGYLDGSTPSKRSRMSALVMPTFCVVCLAVVVISAIC